MSANAKTSSAKNGSDKSSSSSSSFVVKFAYYGLLLYIIGVFGMAAYVIRLHAIVEYGPVIHEFDPWFNFRATQYLYENGPSKFFTWFDYKVWYPLGRPVGSTIYPGMQFTAVFLKNFIIKGRMSLNDVCCYMPAWFGCIASILTGLIGYECSRDDNSDTNVVAVLLDLIWPERKKNRPQTKSSGVSPAVEVGVVSMGIMAMIPAHLMRSVGGGYDNESVAFTSMTLTFWLWTRSLRSSDKNSHWYGILAGIAYFYMVAVWGGYVFVLNLIGVHASLLVVMGRFTPKVYKAYTFFYVVGTALAIQIPVVGWTPLKSLEQLGPCAVFLVYQGLYLTWLYAKKRNMTRMQTLMLRIQVFIAGSLVAALLIYLLAPQGYFGPLSSRVRGLFVKHTRTGNPLVDSVAEHQPANASAYFQYLHYVCYVAPVGFMCLAWNFSDAASFLMVYAVAAYFFSHKMVRLIILLGPIASILSGVVLGRFLSWSVRQFLDLDDSWASTGGDNEEDEVAKSAKKKKTDVDENGDGTFGGKTKKKKGGAAAVAAKESFSESNGIGSTFAPVMKVIDKASSSAEGRNVKRIVALVAAFALYAPASTFHAYCWQMAKALSHPAIMFKAQTRSGETVLVDDYRESYFWLRDNTPEDARVLAWWDYGYQITGIANRTTIADGNTWNHEHIALLGKILTTSEKEGHRIARHLADYALVWAGGGGDDLAKSPHLARIANSVYRGHCPDDVTCRQFGFIDREGTPSAMMSDSFLYKLHSHGLKPGVQADPNRFKEVFRSKYGKVRIYKVLGVSKESKDWVADHKNRICDVPGSWYCKGQYPPALQQVLSQKKDFSQLEDFNRKKSSEESDDDYQKQYFEDLANPDTARARARGAEADRKKQLQEANQQQKQLDDDDGNISPAKLSDEAKVKMYRTWEDNEESTLMWSLISKGAVDELSSWLDAEPQMAYLRSSDGRGPMWWAYEFRNEHIVKLLIKKGVSYKDGDVNGKTPLDMLN
jgi:dolichyl-diphosphooligosaccharide--protein glycosyltransferase